MSASSKPNQFQVQSSTGRYEVCVARGSFEETLRRLHEACILADEFFAPRFAGSPAAPVFLAATEQAKSLDRMPALIEHLRGQGVGRSTHLVAIGGGVVQDTAAFACSIYMRGIAWSYHPTTVLAMVDSCIGGKSSINVGPYKNLVGTFHPPSTILIDPAHALSLPGAEFAGGLIEAAKICFCRGPESFSEYLRYQPSPRMSTAALEQVILESLHAKKHFIELDEFDRKERLLLNLGHTFGHALEGASHYAIPHGIAVGLGILCALAFQQGRGVRYAGTVLVHELRQHLDQLIRTIGAIKPLSFDEAMDRFASDKKHTEQRFTLILVAEDGRVLLEQLERTPEVTLAVRRAMKEVLDNYTQ